MYRKLDPNFPARTAIKKGGTAYICQAFDLKWLQSENKAVEKLSSGRYSNE